MKKQRVTIMFAILIPLATLSILLVLAGSNSPNAFGPVLAAPGESDLPVVTSVDPTSAQNDLDIPITITGTGFTAGLSGTLVITQPAVYLGDSALVNVTWVSSATLRATVPWGLDPDVYTLTVVNPDGEAASLPDAFTVTQGIGEWSTGGPYGGWIESLILGDNQGETVYTTVNNVGLFRSRNGGANWELIFIEIGYLNELEVDPTNTDRLYIAKQASEKTGLYRSEDGGDTWAAMPQPIPGINTRVFLAFVNPHNGTLFGALRADLDDPSCDTGCGLFRFDEANQTWMRLVESGLLDENTGVTAAGFDQQDPNTMYAGLVGGLVLKSTDGGQTWLSLGQTPLSYIHKLVVNPVGREPWVCSPGGELPGGLYKYQGGQWVSMFSTQTQRFTEVKSLVFAPNAVAEQTQHIWIAANADGVLKSEDGGQNWSVISELGSQAIALNPLFPQTIFSGDAEGIAKTSDGGMSWQAINEGLTGIVPTYLGVNPLDPAVLYGVHAGVFGSQNGGAAWARLTSRSGSLVVDPVNPLHVIMASGSSVLIADDGLNFNREIPIPLPPGMDEFYMASGIAMAARPGTWLLGRGYMDMRLPNANAAGGGGIYLSADGENWSRVGPILDCPPTGFAFDPVDENIFYVITSGMIGGINCEGAFLRSTDSGQTWQETMSGLGGVIAVETVPPYRIFDGCSVSEDQGVTWNDTPCPGNGWANSLLFLEGEPSVLYAGTRIGLFRSMDGAQTWQRAQGTLGQLEIWSLAGTTVSDRQILFVATVGGAVDSAGLQAQSLVNGNENLVDAGVYRYTTLPLAHRVYLPLVLR